ncbi:MAG TPA: hypothetical protein VHA82_20700 [Ramlibacter sp.]|uniref:hypothetical protein n=1 Tax=Ramlibacter sp. TaxID=1917967 RepID=UPI002C3D7B52|nr:hypothetical protein [Ramlibacter sp.]HVZ46236.1 hypothetical protein [Ramlibacter sp.]
MRKTPLLLAACLWVAGCAATSAGHAPALRKAIVDVPTVTEAIALQKEIDGHAAMPPPAGEAWLRVIEGTSPVIVTAPHATQPFREGRQRFADGGGTAALAVALHRIAGVTVIYTTYASPSDPNYYDDNSFKAALREQIAKVRPRFVLDLHGSAAARPYEVDLGTMNGRSIAGHEALEARLVEALRSEGLVNISSNYFAAAQQQTITKFAAARGVPAMQLEISTTWLDPARDELGAHRFAQLLQALARFVQEEAR